MVHMSRSVRRTFCRCSSAGMVVRVVTMQILIFSFFPFFFVSRMSAGERECARIIGLRFKTTP